MGYERAGEAGGSLPLTGERTVPNLESENYWFRRHEAAYRFAADRMRGPVLDAGCGEGYGAAMLGSRAGPVIGLELDEPTARHAASTYPSVRVTRGDACRLAARTYRALPRGYCWPCRRASRVDWTLRSPAFPGRLVFTTLRLILGASG